MYLSLKKWGAVRVYGKVCKFASASLIIRLELQNFKLLQNLKLCEPWISDWSNDPMVHVKNWLVQAFLLISYGTTLPYKSKRLSKSANLLSTPISWYKRTVHKHTVLNKIIYRIKSNSPLYLVTRNFIIPQLRSTNDIPIIGRGNTV